MERLWTREASMKYPRQWIVMVHLEDDRITHRSMGDVYLVTNDKIEAYKIAKELGDAMGTKMVVPGFDDTPQIGGLIQVS
jgi:hypothetical protein